MRKKKMRMQLDQNEAEKRCRARAEDTAITSRTLLINADMPQNNFSERSPQLPKSTTIFSSHGCAMRGKLANDANKFLTLLYGTRLFSLGGEDAVRDTHLVEDMRKEMNGWRGEGRAAVEGGDEARDTVELFCEERKTFGTVSDV
ncbi:uncharacterized protein MONOS_11701 [Monocercomonoides exilis]|uniref:uncharacterized protein n=1 Tax=Monocercomonoides exilis TaxID=2049356 RepID=UPI00355A6818|nr:hypothetical protein MONOS_11701 [Monocercomonoides exilis]|eukprot:MONOS_11701.1-p1 / transcript=MONOS_11701.1 / gene=MONOS_11701 / organism=Monocercomonoides_exilis_PA203 / gene_product=unspecified product / transcript_product=unspecified product / location=Mono_scaffold00603:10818-11552(-) / protein_length=145 / sequence_SO=supercontig / SO=protein_coding / is_pseudo=false